MGDHRFYPRRELLLRAPAGSPLATPARKNQRSRQDAPPPPVLAGVRARFPRPSAAREPGARHTNPHPLPDGLPGSGAAGWQSSVARLCSTRSLICPCSTTRWLSQTGSACWMGALMERKVSEITSSRCRASRSAKHAIQAAFICGSAATLLSPLSTKVGTGWLPVAKLCPASRPGSP